MPNLDANAQATEVAAHANVTYYVTLAPVWRNRFLEFIVMGRADGVKGVRAGIPVRRRLRIGRRLPQPCAGGRNPSPPHRWSLVCRQVKRDYGGEFGADNGFVEDGPGRGSFERVDARWFNITGNHYNRN